MCTYSLVGTFITVPTQGNAIDIFNTINEKDQNGGMLWLARSTYPERNCLDIFPLGKSSLNMVSDVTHRALQITSPIDSEISFSRYRWPGNNWMYTEQLWNGAHQRRHIRLYPYTTAQDPSCTQNVSSKLVDGNIETKTRWYSWIRRQWMPYHIKICHIKACGPA